MSRRRAPKSPAAFIRKLRKRREGELHKVRKEINDRGKNTATIEVMPILEAVVDHRLGRSAVEFMAVAYDAAHGGGAHECFCCCRPWAPDRAPVLFVVISYLEAERALGCAVCGECSATDFRDRIISSAERDLGFDRGSVRDIASPGHA
jgi:hypothetical protein